VKARAVSIVAVSGGHTPGKCRALANEVFLEGVNVVQVDERVAPDGDLDHPRTCVKV
jgi:hypothetical protein